MNNIVQLEEEYIEARRKICGHTMGAVYDIIATVNYYLEQVENKPQGLDKYITAYRALLTQRFGRAGGSEHYVASHHPHPNSARGLLSGESRLN